MVDSYKGTNVPYSKTGDKEQDEVRSSYLYNLKIYRYIDFLFQKLLQPFTYILQVPGKQIRAKLAHAFNMWLKISDDKLHVVGDIIQMLHNSSLL